MNEAEPSLTIRSVVQPADLPAIERIINSSGFFRPDEVPVALELVQEGLNKGPDSGYHFILLELDQEVVAYACFGLIPCTLYSYDLYWIATLDTLRGQGLGQRVLREVEQTVATLGGKNLYIETSSLPKYAPTRAFYLKNGYLEKARFEDFYDDGDDKVVYARKVSAIG